MHLKRFVLAWIGSWAAISIGDYLIHQVWLGEFYNGFAGGWRSAADMSSYVGVMLSAQMSLSFLLAFIYTKGYEADHGTVGQGFRFGVLMGLLLFLPMSLMKHFVYPYPLSLVLNWFLGGFLEIVLASMLIGYLYKPGK